MIARKSGAFLRAPIYFMSSIEHIRFCFVSSRINSYLGPIELSTLEFNHNLNFYDKMNFRDKEENQIVIYNLEAQIMRLNLKHMYWDLIY
jgi:hypothetical protein